MEPKIPNQQDFYFNGEMQAELHLALAKRDARKIVKRVDFQKAVSSLERHLSKKMIRSNIVSS